jgi:hypothetical protein
MHCVGLDHIESPILASLSKRQVEFKRNWFTIRGIVLVWVWCFEARCFVFDGQTDVEKFFGSSVDTTCWQRDGRWDISSTNFRDSHMDRLKEFEDAWNKISARITSGFTSE